MNKRLNFITFFILFALALSFFGGIAYAADCGGIVACNCGDTLIQSRTLNTSDSLTDCPGNGLEINGTDITLDCAGYIINGTGGSIGVKIKYSSDNTVVKNCTIYSFGTGIYGNASLGMDLTNNTIYNLSNYNGAAILVADPLQSRGVSANITNNNITSETGSGIFCSVGTANVINNSISGYDYGIESGFQGSWGQMEGNNITTIYSLSGSVVFINSGSPNITENKITGGNNGIYLYTTGSPKVWHNNIYGQSNYKIYSQYPINLSYNNEGNYWGRNNCPVFMPMIDSNEFYVSDQYAYKTLNGWLSESPVDCPPIWTNPLNYTPLNYSPSASQFNITWSDELGVDTVFITIMNSTGHALVNNSSLGTTYGNNVYNYSIVLPVGTFNWTTYANDSAGNWSNSSTWAFTINKGTNPVYVRINNGTQYINQNVVITYGTTTRTVASCAGATCNLYRNGSLASAENNVDVTLSEGVWKYLVNTSGNSNYTSNSTFAYITVRASSGIVILTGGGSAPLIQPGVERSKGSVVISISSVAANATKKTNILKTEDMAFRQIDISVLRSVTNVKIIINKLPTMPSATDSPSDKVYHYIEITKENVNDTDIENVHMEFTVSQSWFGENNAKKSDIALYRWQNSKWNVLNTTYINENDDEVFYSAESPGLSFFAIGTVTDQPTTGCVESWSCTEWTDCSNDIQTRTCTDANSCDTTTNKPIEVRDCIIQAEMEGGELGASNIILYSIIILVIIVVVVFVLYKKKIISLDFLKLKGKFKYKYKKK